MPMTNLPEKDDETRCIEGINSVGDYILILNKPSNPESLGHGYTIATFDLREREHIRNGVIAKQIALAIKEARDIGFEQGRRYVRKALGV